MVKKIVVIGPESTGKSTLCQMLAVHYQTVWVKEYAREYLLKNGTEYSFENLLDIAKGQIALEDAALNLISNNSGILDISAANSPFTIHHPPLFFDTNMYVMKVWCEFVFGKCHHWILNKIVERKYDLYLLCNIDLPWVKDELREYPDLVTREKLYHHYKDIMINQQVPWIDISGNYDERLQKAIKAVDAL
jgi:NadR type nicotinamide-nucleotide adenylyltransferase